MFIYSGECRMGRVGDATPFSDMFDKPLFVGDVVLTFKVSGSDSGVCNYFPDRLTAVVSDEFTSYTDGTHVVKDGPIKPFVMGIASIDLDTPNCWRVMKVKDHSDVLDGEHWRAYGFNYRKEPQA